MTELPNAQKILTEKTQLLVDRASDESAKRDLQAAFCYGQSIAYATVFESAVKFLSGGIGNLGLEIIKAGTLDSYTFTAHNGLALAQQEVVLTDEEKDMIEMAKEINKIQANLNTTEDIADL